MEESLDTTTAGGRFVPNILGAVAQWERETIAERTRNTLRFSANAASGWGASPTGSKSVPTGDWWRTPRKPQHPGDEGLSPAGMELPKDRGAVRDQRGSSQGTYPQRLASLRCLNKLSQFCSANFLEIVEMRKRTCLTPYVKLYGTLVCHHKNFSAKGQQQL